MRLNNNGKAWALLAFLAQLIAGCTPLTKSAFLDSYNPSAIRVYCQPDFNSNGAGLSATACNSPRGISLDGGGFIVADCNNSRALYFPFDSTMASRVYGQLGSYTSNTGNNGGISANSIANNPQATGSDGTGYYIADYFNHRVLYYPGTSTTATRWYGQGTSTSGAAGTGASGLNGPVQIATDSNGVYIADSQNNRVLFYPGTSTTATRVYGQPDLLPGSTAPNYNGISAQSLKGPGGVTVDATGVYIHDGGNARVLFYPGTSTTATRVYGQGGSFTSGTSNNGGVSANSLNANGFVALDSAGVYISDNLNARVLFFPGTSTTATRVYGQMGNFNSNAVNNGGVTKNSLASAAGVAVDANYVYITDQDNNRVLVFDKIKQ